MVISRTKWAKEVLSQPNIFQRSKFFKKFIPQVGDGLLSSIGEHHRFQKKLLSKPFSNSNLINYVSVFEKHADVLVKVCLLSLTFDIHTDIHKSVQGICRYFIMKSSPFLV